MGRGDGEKAEVEMRRLEEISLAFIPEVTKFFEKETRKHRKVEEKEAVLV